MALIRQLYTPAPAILSDLRALLQDAVHGGASVGFLAPLADSTADSYWRGVFDQLGHGLNLWVAEVDSRIIGAVQLDLCGKENGRHRAEVQKLFVHRTYRGRGLSTRLMQTVEEYARSRGRTLLVLDTEAGSTAEAVYRHLGWQPAGRIPQYAASPNGVLHTTAYFYKQLMPPAENG